MRRSETCEYDNAHKRRGPDKRPGARQRSFKRRPEGVDPAVRRRREKQTQKVETRLASEGDSTVKALDKLQDRETGLEFLYETLIPTNTWPQALWDDNGIASHIDGFDPEATTRATGPPDSLVQTMIHEALNVSHEYYAPSPQESLELLQSFPIPDPVFSMANLIYHPRRIASMSKDGILVQVLNAYDYVPRGPSLVFSKQAWWDTLLTLYSHDSTQASQKVFQDLNFLLVFQIFSLKFADRISQLK
jgi:hypothetical protein